MDKDQLTRKLAVILHADVVGSTTLVRIDEVLAHQRIQAAFDNLSANIENYGGMTREVRGDALVALFDRPSDAVSAALAFQARNTESISNFEDEVRPEIRIGISLGEVIVADQTVTGEGVVLAQRLEQIAESGDVVVQGSVSEAVPSRLGFEFESLGEISLKGFDREVRAFVARLPAGSDLPFAEPVSKAKFTIGESLQLPDIPSIAVLPFTNMSGDPEQEYFGDGIAEDIITALSKVSSLIVIARNSTFIYKGRAVDVRHVGQDFGVSYVLEGGVRRAGARIRVTAQLVDAATGEHYWAERYDLDLEDIFKVQDEITRKIVSELDVHLRVGETARLWAGGTESLEAWECVRMALDLINGYQAINLPEAIRLAQKAVDLDPEYAVAWVLLSSCNWHAQEHPGISEEEREQHLDSAREYDERALEIDPSSANAHAHLALHDLHLRKFDEALNSAEKAVKFAPNNAVVVAISSAIFVKCGQPEKALERIRRAMRLSPVYPWWFLMMLGQSTRLLGKAEVAIDAYREIIRIDPDSFEGYVGLAQILGECGDLGEAKAAASEVLRVSPEFSINEYVGNLAYRDPQENVRFAEGLRAAGLPD